MHIAFYTGDHKADAGWKARFGVAIIRLAQRGAKFADATHCEIVLERFSNGDSLIGSATMIPENQNTGGNGVRTKQVALNPKHWRVYRFDGRDDAARALFQKEDGKPYDLFGAVASAINLFLSTGWFCSKIGAEAIGITDGAQFTPAELEAVCASILTEVTDEFFNSEGETHAI